MTFAYDLAPPTLLHDQKTTLWMGELEPWMDEQYIQQLWFSISHDKVIAKVIRDKSTGSSAGYAFIDFGSTINAQKALATFSHQFKLNWASGGGLVDRREDRTPEYSIFVGDLSPECTETGLLMVFQARYRSCKSAKIMTDPRTNLTRGYGFVRFHDQLDQQRSLMEMQGFIIGSRPIRVSVATPKNRTSHSAVGSVIASPNKSPLQLPRQLVGTHDPTNTTVFIGGLSTPIREDELRQYFNPFGEIIYVKIPPGKGCGFVQYVSRQSAELAIQQMNGYQIGSSRIRLSWGRSQNDKTGVHALTALPPPLTSPSQSLLLADYGPPELSTIPQRMGMISMEADYSRPGAISPSLGLQGKLFARPLLDKGVPIDPSAWRLEQIYAQ